MEKILKLLNIYILDTRTEDDRLYIYVDNDALMKIFKNSKIIQKELDLKNLAFTLGMGFEDKEGKIYHFIER